MTAQDFQKKFEALLPTKFSHTNSLQESPSDIRLGVRMLKVVFPEMSAAQRRILFLGHKNPKTKWYNFFGGLNGSYAENAVHTLYKTIFTFLETGWWSMGFDKCNVKIESFDLITEIYTQDNATENLKDVCVIKGDGIVVACIDNSWHYTSVIVNAEQLRPFIAAILEQKYHTKFAGLFLDYEDMEFVGSGFSAVNVNQLIARQ